MPRTKHIYTHKFPYHIVARSNNKEFFPLPLDSLWKIFIQKLKIISETYSFRVHAFVLMSNHYHLVGSCSEEHPLGFVMNWFQTQVAKEVNLVSGRINHTFGGRYKACLITNHIYYYQAIRYVYQNPVRSGLVHQVENYPYSTINSFKNAISKGHISEGWEYKAPTNLIYTPFHEMSSTHLLRWLNENYFLHESDSIKKSLRRTKFVEIPNRLDRSLPWFYERISR